jgi:hypothetical protein
MMSLWIQTALLAAYGLLSLAAIVWCWQFRAVTNLLHTVEQMRSEWDPRSVALTNVSAHICTSQPSTNKMR